MGKREREIKRILFQYDLVPACDADWSVIKFPEPSRCLGSDCSRPFSTTTRDRSETGVKGKRV